VVALVHVLEGLGHIEQVTHYVDK